MICGIDNLGLCLVDALTNGFLGFLSLASAPFLGLIKQFLTENIGINAFLDIWATIVYILSMFYGLFLIWIGLNFIVSGESPEKREKAKSNLKDTIIMMVLIQGSYSLYQLFLGISSALTNVIFSMISTNFFTLPLGSFYNTGFDLFFGIAYVLHLVVVLILVLLRYLFVSFGVVFFPIGIFFYFISPLNKYGKLILNALGVLVFLPFFYSLMFLIGSRLSELSQFSELKSLIMVGALDMIILSTFLLMLFVIVKATAKVKGVVKLLK